jgi:hypothetical protein
MSAIAYKSTIRNWEAQVPLNKATNDHYTESGIRICVPLYVDVPMNIRKELFNAVRKVADSFEVSNPANGTISGISVVSSQTLLPQVESFLGMTLDNLRPVLFTRGGLQADLIFRLQALTGMEVISEKDFADAFTARKKQIKTYVQENTFDAKE